MKWAKDDFFSALKSKSYQQIKSCTSTPLHPICKCYTADDPYPRLTPSPPQRLIEKGNEADKKQSDQLPTLPSLSSVTRTTKQKTKKDTKHLCRCATLLETSQYYRQNIL